MAFGFWWLLAFGSLCLLVAFAFWCLLFFGGFLSFVGFWLAVAFGFRCFLVAFGGFTAGERTTFGGAVDHAAVDRAIDLAASLIF